MILVMMSFFYKVGFSCLLLFSLLIGGKRSERKRTSKYNRQVRNYPHQMEKDCDGRKKLENERRRWSEGRKKYACADGADVEVVSRAFRLW